MVKTVICMKWGTLYGPEYVNKLYYSVRRNVTGDLRFVCFTDDRAGIIQDVECMDLPKITLPYPDSITGWQKISVWQDPLYDLEGDILFLDIDIVVTSSLDPLFSYEQNEFVVIDNWTQPGQNIGNTSVFKFPVGRFKHVYDDLMRDTERYLREFRIEQQYVSAKIPQQKFWPSEWVISFKHSCLPSFPKNLFKAPELPDDAKIVAFHGKPDPIDALKGEWPAPWYKKFYKHVKPTQWIAEHWREAL
ncbi:MAG: hypothetical protein AAF621_07655 [Pseudomonadota bacterium]